MDDNLGTKAQEVVDYYCATLALPHPIRVVHPSASYFGATKRSSYYSPIEYIIQPQIGNFPHETRIQTLTRYIPAIEYLMRHEIGHLCVSGYPRMPSDVVKKVGKLIVEVPIFDWPTFFPRWYRQYNMQLAMQRDEIAVDRVALEMHPRTIEDSLVYTIARSFEDISYRNHRHLRCEIFCHLAKNAALLQILGSLIENNQNITVDQQTYFERNAAVIQMADALIAFHVNNSPGVADTIEKARAKRIPVAVFTYSL